ncbi:hypothetical protein [Pseudaminobacter soli (ex Li et al. 2025)]|uniref:Uncharacterized protein n=1 Tax=Pseudaminobacter soli (ex Li et al. 2025) TaxID=1295366 RepID=A0A2P7RZJ6_9HYPH|nr:hypothetical protein [Mesorhizobium soli]PSJ55596.1 hypothetical protein C7I85_26445 [Mesorhizobium soli]
MAIRFPVRPEFVPPAPRNQKKPTRAAKQRTQSLFLPQQSKEKNNSGAIFSAAGQPQLLFFERLRSVLKDHLRPGIPEPKTEIRAKEEKSSIFKFY